MQIIFNDIPETIQDSSLKSVLESKSLFDKTGIAVAINDYVVPRSKWSETQINANDNILVITATAGG